MQLREARIRARTFDAAAQFERRTDPLARIQAIVGVDVFGAQRWIGERTVAIARTGQVAWVCPAFAQAMQRRDRGQVRADFAAAAGDELHPPRVDVIGLFVGRLQARGVPAVEPRECRDSILQCQRLAPLRVIDLGQRLVPA